MKRKKILLPVLFIYCCISCIIFCVALLQFITKWFPYGSYTVRLPEWLYRFF